MPTIAPAIGLPPPTFLPRRYKPRNVGEWTGHLTFASDLIAAVQPSLIVELGTHWGEAYFTFCQTVQEHGLSTLCYAVDHWLGDEHAGHYGEEVFEEVSRYNDRLYRQFSYLLRRSFDDALAQFAEDSIDLLHIDGLHTYEAVAHDFRSWLPKISAGGFILMHDICPRHQDFGVWRLWEDIKAEFPDTFEFHHSWGLGVVRKPGGKRKTLLEQLLFADSELVREEVRRHYVIYASHLEHILGRMPPVPAPQVEVSRQVRVEVFPWTTTGYSTEVCQVRNMAAGSWNTLVFDLRNPDISAPVRVDPGYEASIIEVGDILIHSGETGEFVWSSAAASDDRGFQLGGTAMPDPTGSPLILNLGDDPNLLLDSIPDLRGPFKLTISLKVTPVAKLAVETFHARLQKEVTNATQRVSAAVQERTALEQQLSATQAQLNQVCATLTAEQTQVSHLRQVLEQLQHSASWRLTEPLRWFSELLKGGTRKP